MTIRETLAAFRELVNTPASSAEDVADDLAAGELLLLSCDPPLSAAAVSHLMAGLVRRRAGLAPRAGLGEELGHCAQ